MIFIPSVIFISYFLITAVYSAGQFEKHAYKPFSLEITGSRFNKHPIDRYNTDPRYDILRRDFVHGVPLDNIYSAYQIDAQAGTPPQLFKAYIDIGSSDMWVAGQNNSYCNTNPSGQGATCSAGVFNYNSSSTFHLNNSNFWIQYQDNTYAKGIWGTDFVSVGDDGAINLANCSIGVALESNTSSGQGILGLGFPSLESTNFPVGGNIPAYTYDNIPQLLRTQYGLDPVAYSMWLNDINSQSGQILFGGVDQDKYEGNLSTIPMIRTNLNFQNPITMAVVLSGISLADVNGNVSPIMEAPISVMFDCGTTLSYLPTNVVDALATSIGAQRLASFVLVDCGLKYVEAAVIFNFSGVNISVPFPEIVFDLPNITFVDGTHACVFGVIAATSGYILGDSFLRSAYVVYDLDNYEVSIANAKYNVTSSNVKNIDANGVPGAMKAPNFSATAVQNAVSALTATGDFSGTRKSQHFAVLVVNLN